MKRKKTEKVIALVLSMLMVFSMMPASVFAGVAENARADAGVIVTVEDYSSGEGKFLLEPTRVNMNGARKAAAIKAAFVAAGKDAPEITDVDEPTDYFTYIGELNGLKSDAPQPGNYVADPVFGPKTWFTSFDNKFDAYDYGNSKPWKNLKVLRVVYTNDFDSMVTGTSSAKVRVNKDKLMTLIADNNITSGAEFDVALKADATQKEVDAAVKALDNPNAIKGLTIEGERDRDVNVNDEVKFTAVKDPVEATETVKWSVDKEEIASIDSEGNFKALKPGTVKVTAQASPAVLDTVTVNIKLPATELTLDKDSVKIPLRGNEKVNVKTLLPEGTTDKVEWSTKEARVATVKDGVITAGETVGKTIVIAKAGKIEAEVKVEVYAVPAKEITVKAAESVKEYETVKAEVTVLPENTTDITRWKSENPEIAKVDDYGNITGISEGTAHIIAMAGDVKYGFDIVVKEGPSIYFVNENGTETKVDKKTNSITLSTLDRGTFEVRNVPVDEMVFWDGQDYRVEYEDGTHSFKYIVNEDGEFTPFGVGNYRAWAALIEKGYNIDFKVNVLPPEISRIRVKYGDKVIDSSKAVEIDGLQNVNVVVEGLADDGKYYELPSNAISFEVPNQTMAFVNANTDNDKVTTVKLQKAGNVKINAKLIGKENVKASFAFEVKPVPVKKVTVNLQPGAVPSYKINYWNFLGGYYVGAQPYSTQNDGYTVTYEPYNTTEKDLIWTPLTPEIATHMEEFSNGIIPKRAGHAEFKVTSAANAKVSTTVAIDFTYKTPLESVTVNKDNYEVAVSNTTPLDLYFLPGDATEQRFDWTYSKDGVVEIQEEVKGDGTYKYFTHNILGLKAGTVTVTGTPMDTTGGAEPIQFTVKVGGGDLPLSKVTGIDKSIKHGMDNLYAPNSAVAGEEWGIFTLARAGHKFTTAEINQYVESVNKSVNKKLANGREPSPTDYATIVLALTSLGQDPRTACDVNFIEKLYNNKNLRNPKYYTSNMLMWTLLALDSHNYEVPSNAANSRDQIVAEILKYQRSNGGFNLVIAGEDDANMLDVTAMAIQALVKYQDKPEVKAAINKGVEYINKRITPNAGFVNEGDENSCTSAQIIVALAALDVNVLDPNNGFVRNNKNIISRIQKFEREGGFVLIEDGRKADGMSTYQVTYALEAFRRYQNNEHTLYDMTDVKLNTDKDAPVGPEVKPEVDKETGDVVIKAEGSKAEVAPDVIKTATNTITVKLTGKTVKYDKAAVTEIQKQLPEDTVKVELVVEKTHRNDENLTLEQLISLGKNKKNLGIFEIKLVAFNAAGKTTEIHNFGNGTATITIDFANPQNLKLEVVRVENDGTFTRVKSSYADGKLTWVTNGHSYYMVAEAGTIRGTITDEVLNNGGNGNGTNGGSTSPETGDEANVLGWMLLMLVAGAAVPLARRKFNK